MDSLLAGHFQGSRNGVGFFPKFCTRRNAKDLFWHFSQEQGWVIGGMKRSRRETWMWTKTSTSTTPISNGMPSNLATTRFFTSSITANGGISIPPNQNMLYGPHTVIMFLPYTGKTHQLRVAAISIGIALMGDPLYETGLPDKHNLPTEDAVHLPYRTMLHASGINIPSCTDNDTPISIWCKPPFYDKMLILRIHGWEWQTALL
jgi:hypothetical protein